MATEYHWILTLTWQTQPGVTARVTASDAMRFPADSTRKQIFDAVRARVAEHHGAPVDAPVMFFSLEPNQLGRRPLSDGIMPSPAYPGER